MTSEKGEANLKRVVSVPETVFQRFLEALQQGGQPAEIIEKLRKTLLGGQVLTEQALREAVFTEEAPK